MEPHAAMPKLTVSNLVPEWDPTSDGGGSYAAGDAQEAVERVLQAPESCEPTAPLPRRSAFSAGILGDREEATWAEDRGLLLTDVLASTDRDDEVAAAPDAPAVDYDDLRRRDIARELLRARLVAIAEQREHRSAYEIVFIMLAAAVAILLAAPPLVQVLLAAHGVQA